jgi:hypothetical protein
VEHRQVEDRPATSWRASGDEPARFLRELRQLRDGAGLGHAELAARAHYPYDRIKAAEVGPTLPDLPVLSAYVRGCGATTEEWEERWRSLTSAPTLPLLDARPAGCSTAASAGARVGSISPVADTPDPSVILAALDRVAEEMAVATPAPLPSRSGVSTIDQRPVIPVSAAAAAAMAAAGKSPGGKAGTAKLSAWETTTMRTAWSSATGPLSREAGQPTAVDRPTKTAGARASGTESASRVAADLGSAGASAAISGATESTRSAGAGGADGSSGSAATKPVSGAARATMTAAAAGPAAIGWRSRGLSRTTVAALIAIAVCVLVALLAMVA